MSTTDPRSAEYFESGWWRHDRLITDDLRDNAARWPDRTAVVTYAADGWTERITVAELHDLVEAAATGLLDLGVAAGEVVCHQLPNWWQFMVVQLACTRIGAVSCPLTPILRRREVADMVRRARARVLIVPETFRGHDFAGMAAGLRGVVDTLEHVLVAAGPRGAEDSFHRRLVDLQSRAGAELDRRRPAVDAVATLQFTSGTTGEPKGVMHTHNSLFATTRLVPWALGLTERDVVVMPSPLAHASGFLYGVLMPLVWGMPVAYQDRWDAEEMLRIVDVESATWTIGSPPFAMDTIEACRRLGRTAGTLRLFSCAGAPIPRHLVEETRRVTGARLAAMWGLTETGAVTITPVADLERARDSDGRPSPAMQVRIVDEAGAACAPGEPGRLLVRGASRFVGYFGRPDLTAAVVDDDGWLDTGDLASLSADGFVTITGRIKDLVIRGGENIPVVEVEDALLQHPGVRDVAVVGLPDPRLGERACAVVVPVAGSGPELAELTAFLAERGFAKQFWPESLVTVGTLPRTPAGKVQKFVLQRTLREDQAAEGV